MKSHGVHTHSTIPSSPFSPTTVTDFTASEKIEEKLFEVRFEQSVFAHYYAGVAAGISFFGSTITATDVASQRKAKFTSDASRLSAGVQVGRELSKHLSVEIGWRFTQETGRTFNLLAASLRFAL